MKQSIRILIAAACWSAAPPGAPAEVSWRVSVKFLTDANGNRPTNGTITNEVAVQELIEFGNALPSFAGRGARLELVEVVDVTGFPHWFDQDPSPSGVREDLESVAKLFQTEFKWRSDAINVYFNNQTAGGCSFPGDGDIIFLGSSNNPWVIIHEIGHFMNLKHTHQGERFENRDGSNCVSTNECTDCFRKISGDDGMDDTLPDNSCWNSTNQIAQANFNRDWEALNAAQQSQVIATLRNIMSYHGDRSIFCTEQLDEMCDTSNRRRHDVVRHSFVFVDRSASGIAPTGSPGAPYKKLDNAIDAAGGGDVILIRPGAYELDATIRKSIQLRAIRRDAVVAGNAIIRAP
jgi:hypothetical protein